MAKCYDPYTYALAWGFIGPCQKKASPSKKIQYLVAIIWNSAGIVPNGSTIAWSQISNEEPLGKTLVPNGSPLMWSQISNEEPLGT